MSKHFGHLTNVACDICHENTVTASGNRPIDWSDTVGRVIEVKVEMVTTLIGFDGDDPDRHRTRRVDICPACFRDKLEPALKALGAVVKETVW
jgi:hypothetical protein